jgi:hypothetical protein
MKINFINIFSSDRSAIAVKFGQQILIALSFGLGLFCNSALGDENSQSTQSGEDVKAVDKPNDGKGELPFFYQADVNQDHFVTKEELKNYPYLLQVFDKVDAGNDGKLEQHEYQNLKMEMKREAEVR